MTATTCGAVGSVDKANWQPLAGRDVIIWPDNDDPGRRFAEEITTRLQAISCQVKWVDIDELNLPPKGDCVDWLTEHPEAGRADIEALPIKSIEDDVTKHKSIEKNDGWPESLADAAYYGLAGEIVKTIEPHSEADPASMLVQTLQFFGNIIGRRPHFKVEGDTHGTNLFTVHVGKTSKGRKGTASGRIRQVFKFVYDPWDKERIMTGLSSGEGLIWAVRDPIIRREKGKDGYEDKEIDHGIDDKRLLVIESEFASTLRVMEREGNTLSPVIRQAWDTGDLNSMTKNNPAKATGSLISIIGHVTADELRRYLTRTEVGNGFANRFLYVCVRRSKCLPEGGQLKQEDLQDHGKRLADTVDFARSVDCVDKDEEARKIWAKVYPELSKETPGLLGAVLSRAEAQVMRLAMLYALLDKSKQIRAPHLKAALALWEYAEASARYIFGSALGDPIADEMYPALSGNPAGVARPDISALYTRHRDAQAIGRALELLMRQGLAWSKQDKTTGRPTEIWFAR